MSDGSVGATLAASLFSGDGLTAYIKTQEAETAVESAISGMSGSAGTAISADSCGKGSDVNCLPGDFIQGVMIMRGLQHVKVDFNATKVLLSYGIFESEKFCTDPET